MQFKSQVFCSIPVWKIDLLMNRLFKSLTIILSRLICLFVSSSIFLGIKCDPCAFIIVIYYWQIHFIKCTGLYYFCFILLEVSFVKWDNGFSCLFSAPIDLVCSFSPFDFQPRTKIPWFSHMWILTFSVCMYANKDLWEWAGLDPVTRQDTEKMKWKVLRRTSLQATFLRCDFMYSFVCKTQRWLLLTEQHRPA